VSTSQDTVRTERPETHNEDVPFGLRLKAWFAVAARSGWFITVLAIIIAFIVGAFFIWMAGASVTEAYWRLFRGAIFNPDANGLENQLVPLTNTLRFSTPLILAGLGLMLGFRAGLFNIGGQGQVIIGAIVAGWVGFTLDLPAGIHLIVAILAAVVAAGIYGGLAGLLKATTGANEVIVTIMLNSIAGSLLIYVLTKEAFLPPGSRNPKSRYIDGTAELPDILPAPFNLHAGFLIAIVATFFVWWILERSTFGFQLRAVGANPNASLTSGMSIGRIITLTMFSSACLTGLAGATEVLGSHKHFDASVAGSIGFDAITVALLGRNKPLGTFFAGLLFGAFRAGSSLMQGAQTDAGGNLPVDIILILQSVIVLLVAAPPFIRWIFRLPKGTGMSVREYITLHQKSDAVAAEAQTNADSVADVEPADELAADEGTVTPSRMTPETETESYEGRHGRTPRDPSDPSPMPGDVNATETGETK